MNNKIKELREKRAAANFEKHVALFAKQNADADYRKKLETFNKIDEQLQKAVQEEAENDARN
jgi:conserved domain protein